MKKTSQEKGTEEINREIVIPPWVKWPLVVVFALILLVCFYLYWQYIACPTTSPSPSELGLASITIFCLTVTVILLIPWAKFGIRISKIGFIEFEQIVAAQASENNEILTYLEERIETIEDALRQTEGTYSLNQIFNEPELYNLLKKFFMQYHDTAISALKIRTWGASQSGFEKLSKFDHGFVRHILRKLVNEGFLSTKLSKKGNTLYKFSEE
ncbi:hypothetical protein [uncultured Desulfuromusa sp.]|uniref:hypothetical protein n=1 Tax=uncultured Desulfuromusa sp. TaxID=219183 RepID=UPI002AA61058|nr:hypothetical protein [uncultured Desulfuromusa sp.]